MVGLIKNDDPEACDSILQFAYYLDRNKVK